MRFAGSAPITDFLSQSVDMGSVAQKAAQNRSALKNAGTQLEGEVGAAGVSTAGKVEAAGIVGAAQASLASAQGQAAIMGGIGDIAGSAIGAFGKKTGGTGFADLSEGLSGTEWSSYSQNFTPKMNFFGT